MSFSDMILSPADIVEMYKNNLVETITESNKKKGAKGTSTQYLGKNLKNILVFVNYPEEVYLPAVQLEFLEKILVACKLDVGDIAIVNTAKHQEGVEDQIKMLQPKTILIFDSSAPVLGGNTEMSFFTPYFLDEITVMNAPALEKISEESTESKQLKGKLWTGLRQIFNV